MAPLLKLTNADKNKSCPQNGCSIPSVAIVCGMSCCCYIRPCFSCRIHTRLSPPLSREKFATKDEGIPQNNIVTLRLPQLLLSVFTSFLCITRDRVFAKQETKPLRQPRKRRKTTFRRKRPAERRRARETRKRPRLIIASPPSWYSWQS